MLMLKKIGNFWFAVSYRPFGRIHSGYTAIFMGSCLFELDLAIYRYSVMFERSKAMRGGEGALYYCSHRASLRSSGCSVTEECPKLIPKQAMALAWWWRRSRTPAQTLQQ